MKTTTYISLSGLGLAVAVMVASGAASADASALHALAPWIWLYNLPDLVLIALVAIFFTGLAWGLGLYRWRGGRGQGAPYYVLGAGAVLGLLVAVFTAGPWKSNLFDHITGLPPTAVGPVARWSPELLGPADALAVASPPEEPAKAIPGRARHASVNVAALGADRLVLNLFDDTRLTAVRDRVDQDLAGGMAWVGHVEGAPNSEVVLAAKGDVLMGTVDLVDRFFEIVDVARNTHAVRELNPGSIPAQFEPTATDLTVGASTAAKTAVGSTGQVIDLMMLYTPAARGNAGGYAGIETRIMNAVTRANHAYLNSQLDIHLNLVYLGEVEYIETGDMAGALKDLQGADDGYMDEVQMLRNLYAADLVTLVDTDSNYCGIANTLPTLSTGWDTATAFSVVHDDSVYNCLGSQNMLAHVIGHELGDRHDRDGGATNDSAGSMAAVAPTVASFRIASSVTAVPLGPIDLMAAADTADSITLNWTNGTADAVGNRVQRSVDGVHWVEIATVAPDAVDFIDTGLLTDLTYSYRVYAYNSIGNSAISNEVAATLGAAPSDATPPLVTIATASTGGRAGAVMQVAVSATDNAALGGLKLYIDSRLVGATNSATLNYSWNTKKAAAGNHIITAEAIDTTGNVGSATRTVTIP